MVNNKTCEIIMAPALQTETASHAETMYISNLEYMSITGVKFR